VFIAIKQKLPAQEQIFIINNDLTVINLFNTLIIFSYPLHAELNNDTDTNNFVAFNHFCHNQVLRNYSCIIKL